MLNPGHPTQNTWRLGWENRSSEGGGRRRRDSLLIFPLQKEPVSSTHTNLKQSQAHHVLVAQESFGKQRRLRMAGKVIAVCGELDPKPLAERIQNH